MSSIIERTTPVHFIGKLTIDAVAVVGDLCLFTARMLHALVWRRPRSRTLWPILYEIGFCSMPVILVTGMFLGMVLAVQSYDQLRAMHLENRIGSVINISLVKELGPVLAAVMLAGRVGSAIAAEIGTMRVTEQIDALRMLGADPIGFLVVPRFLACFLLIPVLTILADGLGMLGGWYLSTQVLGVSTYLYWSFSDSYITSFDVITGLIKSIFFGGAIAIMACYRGFHCGAGAEGVGRAATEAFVYSFIVILALDFGLGAGLLEVQKMIGGFRGGLM